MATVIERPSERIIERREVVDRSDSGAGWAIALIVLVALLVAGFIWARYYRVPVTPNTGGTNINVSVPQTPNTGTVPNADSGPGNVTGPSASTPSATQSGY